MNDAPPWLPKSSVMERRRRGITPPGTTPKTGPISDNLVYQNRLLMLKNMTYNDDFMAEVLAEHERHFGEEAMAAWLADITSPKKKASPPARPPAPLPMKQRALVESLRHEWRTIEADINNASRNGLSEAARIRGGWDAERARQWAESKGKLSRHGLLVAGLVSWGTRAG